MEDGFAAQALPRQWEFTAPVPLGHSLDGLLGIEVSERRAGYLRARMLVRDAVRHPMGWVHGGAYSALAQMLASAGTLDGVSGLGKTAFVISNDTEVLEPVSGGTIEAVARITHQGDESWFWEVRMSTGGETCALCRVRVAVGSPGELGVEAALPGE